MARPDDGVTTLFARRLKDLTDADVLRLAASATPEEAVFGRLLSTGIAGQLQAFVNEEARRHTSPERIAGAIENVAASAVASIAVRCSSNPTRAIEIEAVNFATMLRAAIRNVGEGLEKVGGSS